MVIKKCVVCGEKFETIRKTITCSAECHKKRFKKSRDMYRKQWYEENKEKVKKQNQKYYQKNKEKVSKKQKEYYQKNKEKIKQYHKQYYQENKERINQKRRERYRKKYGDNFKE